VSKKLGGVSPYLVNPFKISSKQEGDSVLLSVSSPVHRKEGDESVVVVVGGADGEREIVNGSVITQYSGMCSLI
jgi:hypothetical protein